jgi:arylsulfatase
MDTLERLANEGLRYNQFHTTAVCSATRAAMLTGRNHHTANTGSIMESATAYPGNTGQRPDSVAHIARMLRYNGYATAQFGKQHETPAWEVSASGPTDRWPTRTGFDKFYGFIAGETNQWAPAIYDGMTLIEVPQDPNYHFMTDMTNQAIQWVRSVKSLTPDKPFFLYFAPGATHAPPKAVKARGEIRSQWHHVVDITPTILEAAGLPEPKTVEGVPQTPIEGVSMVYSFNDAKAKDARLTQYFEIFGNRAIYHDGWLAGTVHKAPWESKPRATLDNDTWELYDTTKDFSLANDLSRQNPAKLKKMQALFLKEAEKYRVLPIDDRGVERMNAEIAGRPDVMAGRTSLTVYEGLSGLSENVFINTKNRSHTVTAEVVIPKGSANGVILAQAERFGGWSLYLKDGKPTYAYNFLGQQRSAIAAKEAVPAGKATIRYQFVYDGGGLGKGGLGTIFVNDEKVAEGRIERTHPVIFSADEGADVGEDAGTPVVEHYGIPAPHKFTGTIDRVTVEIVAMKTAERAEERKALAVAARAGDHRSAQHAGVRARPHSGRHQYADLATRLKQGHAAAGQELRDGRRLHARPACLAREEDARAAGLSQHGLPRWVAGGLGQGRTALGAAGAMTRGNRSSEMVSAAGRRPRGPEAQGRGLGS